MGKKEGKAAWLTRNVLVAGLVSLMMDFSSEMVYPLVPLFLTTVLGASRTAVGVIEGVAEATASILKVFSGWLSDRLGRRKLLMGLGYAVSTTSRPVIASAGSWFQVLTARFIDRFGKGVRTAPRDAIIAESTGRRSLGAAYGFHRSMDTVGAIIGPAAAFAMLAWLTDDLRTVFYASAVPGVVAVLLIVLFIREKASAPPGPEEKREVPRLSVSGFNSPFRRYVFVVGLFSLATFSEAFFILRAEDVGVEPAMIPVIYLVFNVVYAASSTPAGLMADRVGLGRTTGAGIFYYAAVTGAMALATSPIHLWLLFALYGVYKGVTEGVQRAFLAALAPEARRATAFGVYHTVVGLALLPASVVAGWLWDTVGPSYTFIYGSGLAAVSGVLFFALGLGRRGGDEEG